MHFPSTLTASADDAGRRLDQFLTERLPDVSRARVQQAIENGAIRVNGEAAKASLKLRGNETIEILAPLQAPPLRAFPENIALDLVYEDADLAVVNKPAGMMVHAGAGATDDARNRGTLVNALLHRFGALSSAGGETRPGIVHRLDKQTSGLVVIAKNDRTHRRLSQQFAARKVHKKYIALVHGWMKEDSGTVHSAIGRDLRNRARMSAGHGRDAITHFRVLRRVLGKFGKFTLVEAKIETGRTHQIRVHMASIGHPVVGDELYGAPAKLRGRQASAPTLGRNFLHAAAIEFMHPETHVPVRLQAALPPELEEFLSRVEER